MSVATKAAIDDGVIDELRAIIGGDDRVLPNISSRVARTRTPAPFPVHRWSDFLPDVAVLPTTAQQVSEVMKLANRLRIPVVGARLVLVVTGALGRGLRGRLGDRAGAAGRVLRDGYHRPSHHPDVDPGGDLDHDVVVVLHGRHGPVHPARGPDPRPGHDGVLHLLGLVRPPTPRHRHVNDHEEDDDEDDGQEAGA